VRIEYTLPFRRTPVACSLAVEPPCWPGSRGPRIARLLGLAHKLDGMVRSGAVRDYAELARLGHVSPARLSQMMLLLQLSPTIQEHILFLDARDARFVPELAVRKIAREPRWDRQRQAFERLLKK
jgi:hypothetical protein